MLPIRIHPESTEPHGLTRGETYAMDDHNGAEYVLKGWGSIAGPHMPAGEWCFSLLVNGWLLLVRLGGFGDLICLRPLLERLWLDRKYEGITRLVVCCHPAHAAALDGLEGVEVIDYPPTQGTVDIYGWVLPLEGVVENSPHDSVAAFASVAWARDVPVPHWTPTYQVPAAALAAAKARFPITPGRRRIGLALHSSAHCRNWPLERVAELIHGLGAGVEVFLFGKPGPWPEIELGPEVTHVHMLPRLDFAIPTTPPLHHSTSGLTLRESLAVLATMDAFVGPDSGLVHAAGAMQIPTVALFGPFEARQRVARYPSVRVIQGRAPCAPCHHHPRTPEQRWPAGKPCQTMQHCVAMAGITGAQVLEALKDLETGRQGAEETKA